MIYYMIIYIIWTILYGVHRGDAMILTFHVPPLARGWGVPTGDYVISIVYSPEKFRKISKNWEVLAKL